MSESTPEDALRNYANGTQMGDGIHGLTPDYAFAVLDELALLRKLANRSALALADATKRAESAEQENATRVKEYREKVEQLETDKAFYHDKWLNALERLKAAEQEDARMSKRLSMDALESDVAALLAQPKGGPDA